MSTWKAWLRCRGACHRLREYFIDQLQQTSTWRGIALIVTVAGGSLTPINTEALVLIGLFISGAIAVIFPDTLKKRRRSDGRAEDRAPGETDGGGS